VRFSNSLLNKPNFCQHVAPVRAEINTVQVTGKVYVDAQEIKPLNKDKNIPGTRLP